MKIILNIIIITTLFLSISFFCIEKETFSENENRNLAIFPKYNFEKLLSGEYTMEIENYINDHFPLRNKFLILKSNVEVFIGKQEINDTYVTDYYLFQKYEKNNELENIVNTLNNFYKKNSNVDINMILVPSSSYINNNNLPKYTTTELEKNDLYYIKKTLNINMIDITTNLFSDNKINDVYFKSDHHFNIHGAYSVYKSFKESKGEKIEVEYDFSLANTEFLGTLSSKVNQFDGYVDELYYYLPKNKVVVEYVAESKQSGSLFDYSYLRTKDKYSFYLGGNYSLIKIKSDIKNDKSILIIKDSFANSFIPFITEDYENIHIIDLRFYNLSISDYIEENNIEEVLLFYSTSGFNGTTNLNILR